MKRQPCNYNYALLRVRATCFFLLLIPSAGFSRPTILNSNADYNKQNDTCYRSEKINILCFPEVKLITGNYDIKYSICWDNKIKMEKYADLIIKESEKLKPAKDQNFDSSYITINCTINNGGKDTILISVGEGDYGIIKQGCKMEYNDYFVYLVRMYCGYYNWVPRKDLKNWFKEVKKYGILENYIDIHKHSENKDEHDYIE